MKATAADWVAGLRPQASGPGFGPKCDLAHAVSGPIQTIVGQGWGLALYIGIPLVIIAFIIAVLSWRQPARVGMLRHAGWTIALLIGLSLVVPVLHLVVGNTCG